MQEPSDFEVGTILDEDEDEEEELLFDSVLVELLLMKLCHLAL